MKKLIDFTDKAVEMVKFIQANEGHKSFIGALHAIISAYYNRSYFSKYKGPGTPHANVPSEKLTNEQLCERAGGKVGEKNGNAVCLFRKEGGGLTGSVLLDSPERFAEMAARIGVGL